MDGAPYLRKVDLKMYKSYQELFYAVATTTKIYTISKHGALPILDFMNESKLMDLLNSSESQVVGWPPVRSYRKNVLAQKNASEEGFGAQVEG
ncbi:hypothetical protein CWS33_31320, partial [Escherichia coli]